MMLQVKGKNHILFNIIRPEGLRGVIIFFGILVLCCTLLSINGVKDYWEGRITLIITSLAARTLSYLGLNIKIVGNSIAGEGYSVVIGPDCLALYEVVIFAAAIVAYPMRKTDKFAGILIGAIIIQAVNLLRVVVLFLSGAYYPNIFKILHDHVAQALLILLMVILWILWVVKSDKNISSR